MEKTKKYVCLSDSERSEIEILKNCGYSNRKIAKALSRSPNTIGYEIKANSIINTETGVLEYVAKKAKAKSRLSRRSRRYQWRKIEHDPHLWKFVIKKLKAYWSPYEIAGYLKKNPRYGFYASGRQIYDWLYSSYGQPYCQYLYSHRYHPRKHTKKTERVMIPDRNPIATRTLAAESRLEPGHCEYDSVVSNKRSHSTFALAVVVERTTRFVSAMVVPNLKPEAFANAIVDMVGDMRIVSLTTDNGIENKQHSLITKATGATVYHTDPYSSWQKGSVENANKMLRRYFPKGTDFSAITQAEVDRAISLINQKPRKILGYKSAIQVAYEKGIISSQRKALSETVVSY